MANEQKPNDKPPRQIVFEVTTSVLGKGFDS
jgi:hypothetical protein